MTATTASIPGSGSRPASPESGIRTTSRPLPLAEGRDSREQAEIDGERLPSLRPEPPSDRGHPEPGRVAVERNRERQSPRIRGST